MTGSQTTARETDLGVALPLSTRPRKRTLLVFDFDWTMIDCNSDPFVLEQVGASEIFRSLRSQRVKGAEDTGPALQWTRLMDESFSRAHEQLKIGKKDIVRALEQAPLADAMKELLRRTCDRPEIEVIIVSDSNTIFIEEILRHHRLREYISEIHTNEGKWEENERLRILPFHRPTPFEDHGCALCPPNMCKGQILQSLLEKRSTKRPRKLVGNEAGGIESDQALGVDGREYGINHGGMETGGREGKGKLIGDKCESRTRVEGRDETTVMDKLPEKVLEEDDECGEDSDEDDLRVIYVGDGGGDFCPSTYLRRNRDFVLARDGFPLLKKINKHLENQLQQQQDESTTSNTDEHTPESQLCGSPSKGGRIGLEEGQNASDLKAGSSNRQKQHSCYESSMNKLEKKSRETPPRVEATVHAWKTAEDMCRILTEILEQ